jgi:hypothetical protein
MVRIDFMTPEIRVADEAGSKHRLQSEKFQLAPGRPVADDPDLASNVYHSGLPNDKVLVKMDHQTAHTSIRS